MLGVYSGYIEVRYADSQLSWHYSRLFYRHLWIQKGNEESQSSLEDS